MGRAEQDTPTSAKNSLPICRSVIEYRTCPGQALHKKSILQKKQHDHRNKNGIIITRKLNHSSGLSG